MRLTFVETPLFAASAKGVLTDVEMRALQDELLENPRAGDVERGTGGARKLRVALQQGKSGGARVHYVYVEARAKVYLLLTFPKNEAPALSATGRNTLRTIVQALHAEEERHGHQADVAPRAGRRLRPRPSGRGH